MKIREKGSFFSIEPKFFISKTKYESFLKNFSVKEIEEIRKWRKMIKVRKAYFSQN